MGYGLWVMGYGLWVMGYGLWVMGYGLWVMGIKKEFAKISKLFFYNTKGTDHLKNYPFTQFTIFSSIGFTLERYTFTNSPFSLIRYF
jgi:hypothetical protein